MGEETMRYNDRTDLLARSESTIVDGEPKETEMTTIDVLNEDDETSGSGKKDLDRKFL